MAGRVIFFVPAPGQDHGMVEPRTRRAVDVRVAKHVHLNLRANDEVLVGTSVTSGVPLDFKAQHVTIPADLRVHATRGNVHTFIRERPTAEVTHAFRLATVFAAPAPQLPRLVPATKERVRLGPPGCALVTPYLPATYNPTTTQLAVELFVVPEAGTETLPARPDPELVAASDAHGDLFGWQRIGQLFPANANAAVGRIAMRMSWAPNGIDRLPSGGIVIEPGLAVRGQS